MGRYRDCCATSPQTFSNGERFADWWTGKTMRNFRILTNTTTLPPACGRCEAGEKINGNSFRLSINSQESISSIMPSRWNVAFGNICNLACWTCNAQFSSVIETQLKQLGKLSGAYENTFNQYWPDIQSSILESYKYHEIITLTFSGGEPFFNKDLVGFLNKLANMGLKSRTRLEIHTNCSKRPSVELAGWNYLCLFFSIDAIGKKAEWLRYGCNWNTVDKNLQYLRTICDYCQIHTTVSILNVADLWEVSEYAANLGIPQTSTLVSNPSFMNLAAWDGPPICPVDNEYYSIVGSQIEHGSYIKLKNYISQFSNLRKPLVEFNPTLSIALSL